MFWAKGAKIHQERKHPCIHYVNAWFDLGAHSLWAECELFGLLIYRSLRLTTPSIVTHTKQPVPRTDISFPHSQRVGRWCYLSRRNSSASWKRSSLVCMRAKYFESLEYIYMYINKYLMSNLCKLQQINTSFEDFTIQVHMNSLVKTYV